MGHSNISASEIYKYSHMLDLKDNCDDFEEV